jgi:hypothetical protein
MLFEQSQQIYIRDTLSQIREWGCWRSSGDAMPKFERR